MAPGLAGRFSLSHQTGGERRRFALHRVGKACGAAGPA